MVEGVQEFFQELEKEPAFKTCDPQIFNDIGGPTFIYESQFQKVLLHNDGDGNVNALSPLPRHLNMLKQL
eukprot:5177124-Karenia_brevis.AAC.1